MNKIYKKQTKRTEIFKNHRKYAKRKGKEHKTY